MALQEIPREQWKTYFENLSREYESGMVRVEVRGQPLPQQPALTQIPLLGISYEEKGSGQGRIDIMVGSDADATNASHTIAHPTRVQVEGQDGSVDTLTIDAEEGEPVTIVSFLSAT